MMKFHSKQKSKLKEAFCEWGESKRTRTKKALFRLWVWTSMRKNRKDYTELLNFSSNYVSRETTLQSPPQQEKLIYYHNFRWIKKTRVKSGRGWYSHWEWFSVIPSLEWKRIAGDFQKNAIRLFKGLPSYDSRFESILLHLYWTNLPNVQRYEVCVGLKTVFK